MKIASMKNANASSANGSPITEPHRPINPGQNSPRANDRTVPDTAPIATRMPSALAHRRVMAIHTASSLRIARYSVNTRSSGTPMASAANTMWKPRATAICALAACSDVSASPMRSPRTASCHGRGELPGD